MAAGPLDKMLLAALIALPMGAAVSSEADDARHAAQQFAPINSQAQLEAELAHLSPLSPLASLSETARARFTRSLRFNEKGLATFNYNPIVEELSASQARRLLALFGVERALPSLPGLRAESEADRTALQSLKRPLPGHPVLEDHPGHQCVGRANCATSPSFICMSSC